MSFAESLESLKKFDVNDLDFNRAGTWPLLIQLIVFVIVFSALLGGGYWFLIQDQFAILDGAAQKEVELRREYESKAHKVANLPAFKQQMVEMEESFGALLKQLPTDTEVPGLLEDVTNTGIGNGLEFKSITLKPEVSREFYVELPIEIKVVGGYHEIASFVSGVAGMPRIVTLHDFTIKPVAKSDEEVLEMTITARTYRYNAGRKK
ncbi:MAG: type 4a pilus biogenesis protein PilO [Hahellaceae bacterium]|nr:type 4a pilus biogenesis protein PilO [Hahellaceae bacterium]MCP5168832.1 type 4a pilus biogenesis protein PilO [Hahellaceae bacterium]